MNNSAFALVAANQRSYDPGSAVTRHHPSTHRPDRHTPGRRHMPDSKHDQQIITLQGGSDDLIVIGGSIEEEFSYEVTEGGDLVAFSDGTLLRIEFTGGGKDGVWRITPVVRGTAALTIEQALEDDPTNYSDTAELAGPITWVAHAIAVAKAGA